MTATATDAEPLDRGMARSSRRACRFCDILRGESEAFLVLEDERAVAFLDRRPLLHGHCLLVPRAHLETFLDLPADEVGPLFLDAQRLARAVERAMDAHGSFVAINTRISQSVPHLHVHVVPRWKDDGLFSPKLIWKRRPYRDADQMRAIQSAIRTALDAGPA